MLISMFHADEFLSLAYKHENRLISTIASRADHFFQVLISVLLELISSRCVC